MSSIDDLWNLCARLITIVGIGKTCLQRLHDVSTGNAPDIRKDNLCRRKGRPAAIVRYAPFHGQPEVDEQWAVVNVPLAVIGVSHLVEDVQKVIFTVRLHQRRRQVWPTHKVNRHHVLLQASRHFQFDKNASNTVKRHFRSTCRRLAASLRADYENSSPVIKRCEHPATCLRGLRLAQRNRLWKPSLPGAWTGGFLALSSVHCNCHVQWTGWFFGK